MTGVTTDADAEEGAAVADAGLVSTSGYVGASGTVVDAAELGIDVLFMLDILINFISAYEDREKNIIFQFHKIVLNYITSWFFLDVVSSIPY